MEEEEAWIAIGGVEEWGGGEVEEGKEEGGGGSGVE